MQNYTVYCSRKPVQRQQQTTRHRSTKKTVKKLVCNGTLLNFSFSKCLNTQKNTRAKQHTMAGCVQHIAVAFYSTSTWRVPNTQPTQCRKVTNGGTAESRIPRRLLNHYNHRQCPIEGRALPTQNAKSKNAERNEATIPAETASSRANVVETRPMKQAAGRCALACSTP